MSRAVRWKVSPRYGEGSARLPSTARSTPWLRRMRANVLTSARFGTFLRVSRSGVSKLAIINGRAAFLAPEMDRLPFRCLPPTMLMRSMRCARPLRWICEAVDVSDALYATRQAKKRSASFRVRIVGELMHGRTRRRCARARLGLALGQVGRQL